MNTFGVGVFIQFKGGMNGWVGGWIDGWMDG